MDIQIKKNDALTVLASSVKLSIKQTESRILSFLKREFPDISTEVCGYSIVDISKIEGFDIKLLMNTCFLIHPNNSEVQELLDAVFVIGFKDCPECGCELVVEKYDENGMSWEDTECTNCPYAISGEPDLDSMPGGHDDY